MDITSFLLGKNAGGGGGGTPNLQSKSVTITENKTTNIKADTGYDGLSSVEVTTNVSGSTPTPTTATECATHIIAYASSFDTYLNSLVNNYSAYTNNSLTIHAPNQYVTSFMIQKRSNGKYRIVWSKYGYYCCLNSSSQQGFCNLRLTEIIRYLNYSNFSTTLGSLLLDNTLQNTNDDAYYSTEYSTLEALITALQTQNGVSYTRYGSGFVYSGVLDNDWPTPITNIPIFESDMSTPITNGKVLSHNLTIVADS